MDETWAKARLLADKAPARPSAIEPLAAAAEKLAQEAQQKAAEPPALPLVAPVASPEAAPLVVEPTEVRADQPEAAPATPTTETAALPIPSLPPVPTEKPAASVAKGSGHPGEEPLPEPISTASLAAEGAVVEPSTVTAPPEFIAKAKAVPANAGARWLWRLGALIAVLLLAAQAAHAFRDRIVAEWPEAKPWIAELCGLTREFLPCKPAAPKRDAAQISIEYHELSSDSKAVLVLTALLRNKAEFTQALPSLEVTLVDQSRQVIARRTLPPNEYLDPAQGKVTELAPNAEAQARLLIKGEGVSAATYNLQVVY